MSMTAVRETQCTTCIHREVCALKNDFLAAQKAIDNIDISLGNERFTRLGSMAFIVPVDLKCRFYLKKELTVRGGV